MRIGEPVEIGKRVIVIGGGDVAFDAGRTALRLGAEQVVINCIEGDDPDVYSLGPDNQEGGCDPGRGGEFDSACESGD